VLNNGSGVKSKLSLWSTLPERLIWKIFSAFSIGFTLSLSRVCVHWNKLVSEIIPAPKRAFLELTKIRQLLFGGNVTAETEYDTNGTKNFKQQFSFSCQTLRDSGVLKQLAFIPPTLLPDAHLNLFLREQCLKTITWKLSILGTGFNVGTIILGNVVELYKTSQEMKLEDGFILDTRHFLELLCSM